MAEKVISCFFDKSFESTDVVEAVGKNTKGWTCPTNDSALEKILSDVDDAINSNVNTILLENCHYPTNWNTPVLELFDTCYCDRCLTKFSEHIGEKLYEVTLEDIVLLIDGSYYIEWMEFKIDEITNIIKKIKTKIDISGKMITTGLVVPPWENKENGEGTKRLLGLELERLSTVVDFFRIPIDEIDPRATYFKDLGFHVHYN